MKHEALLESLREAGRLANQMVAGRLNCGGCMVWASIVADRLAELGVEAKGVVATYVGRNVTKARPEDPTKVERWNANGLDFNHVGLAIKIGCKVYFYDSNALFPSKDGKPHLTGFPVIPGRLSRDEMRALAADVDAWNCLFPRKRINDLKDIAESMIQLDGKPKATKADEELLEKLAA